MAAATYYGLGKKAKKLELEKGRENIRDLVAIFRTHAIGSENDMHLNHVGFQSLCHELRLGSHDLSNRLFAAMDADNTGAVDVNEFWNGVLSMHEPSTAPGDRLGFAFNLFNVERTSTGELDDRVDHAELVGFLSSFYAEACDLRTGWLRRWIDHFETIFGADVASVTAVGNASPTRWEETGVAQSVDEESHKQVRLAARAFSDSVLELVRVAKASRPVDDGAASAKKKGGANDSVTSDDGDDDDDRSLGAFGFHSWCEASDKKMQLHVLPWIEDLGNAWLKRSGLPPEERLLDGLASPTLGFEVQRMPGGEKILQQKFAALQEEQIYVLFATHSSNSLMACSDFDDWLHQLGVSNPYIRERLFDVFDCDNDRFLDYDEFESGLKQLVAGKPKNELAFALFDVDGNGVIGEDELRVFMQSFFEVLVKEVNESMRVLETLLSPENEEVITVATTARDACQQFVDSYTDAVVQNVFRAAKFGPPGKRKASGGGSGNAGGAGGAGGQSEEPGEQKLFISEFTCWCRENNDSVLAFLESLSNEIMTEMEAFKVLKPKIVAGQKGGQVHDHRSKLARQIDPSHHWASGKRHLLGLSGFRHIGASSLMPTRPGYDVLTDRGEMGQQQQHLFTADFHRVLAATGVEWNAGVVERHSQHWSSKRLAISAQVARSESTRKLIEGKKAMKGGDLDAAVLLFAQGIEQEKHVQEETISERILTKEDVDEHNKHKDDLFAKGILDRDQVEMLKGGITESLEEELQKAITARDERDFIIVDEMLEQQKTGKSALDKKHAEAKQPGRLTGAPKVPPPSSCFPRDEVHRIQDIFLAVSQDGCMGPAEWTRCLRFAGIENEVTALRLFEIFDSSGDLQLNAKEFTCGLSEICNAYQPGKALGEVRREFAFRFYDVDGEGHFDKKECCGHLKSYRLAARKAIDREVIRFCTAVFGMDDRDLAETIEPKLSSLTNALDQDLMDFVEDIYALFGDDKGEQMNWEQFKRFSLKAPMVVEWLTTLGKDLKESFSNMDKDLNFEQAAPIAEPGMVISEEKVRNAFTRFAGEGGDNALIDEDEFVELVSEELSVNNRHLARLLFHAFDEGGNGTITRSEFVSRWKIIAGDDLAAKQAIVFKLYDVKGQGFVDKAGLRLFYLSFFDSALESVASLRQGLDVWVNGKAQPNSKLSNGVPNHFFVGVSRKKKFELAKDLLKVSHAHVSLFVDAAVDHSLRKVAGKLTLRDGFAEFLSDKPTFVNWLSTVPSPWMVMPSATAADVNLDLVVIQPGDVGKTAEAVLDSATKAAMASASLAELAPGSIWWARAINPPPETMNRIVMRPQTHFDRVWLADIKSLFAESIAACRVYDPESLAVVLDHGIGLTNPLISDRLYRMFDVNQDGNLTAAEIATGLLLLGMGSLSERMQLAFEMFDISGDGMMMSQELGMFLGALRAVSIDVVDSQIELLGEVFGPPSAGVGHGVRKAKEFKETIHAEARKSLDVRVDKLQEFAFPSDDVDAAGAAGLTLAEFQLFLSVQPAFEVWVGRLGVGCLEALAPLEDRALPTTGRRPTDSAYRSRRKYPKGTQFDHLRVDDVLERVKRHAHYGWLDQHAFAQVMSELQVYEPASLRRLHTLLDFSNGGSLTAASSDRGAGALDRARQGSKVHVRDASATLLLLSGDSWRVQLRAAFFIYDADGRGRLYRAEWLQMLRSLSVVGLDVIRTAVCGGLIADLVGESEARSFSATVLGLSHGRLQAWLNTLDKSCKLFCDLARQTRRKNLEKRGPAGMVALAAMDEEDKGDTYIWEDVEAWAKGHADFGRWIDSLRNLWLESILESETGQSTAKVEEGEPKPVRGFDYGYEFVVKKVFALSMAAAPAESGGGGGPSVLAKKLTYTNPYGMPLTISLHTDSPALLTATIWDDPEALRLKQVVPVAGGGVQIAPGCSTKLSLRFAVNRGVAGRRRGRGRDGDAATGQEATIRLFVHNETEGRCEECIQFDLSGV